MSINLRSIYFLFMLMVFMLAIPMIFDFSFSDKEGFDLAKMTPDDFKNLGVPLLAGEYPLTGNRLLPSAKQYQDIWQQYPIFQVGSYEQITNNLKYRPNPDDGECRRAEMCDALYLNKVIDSNIAKPLPPVPDTEGTRINYYRTPDNLFLGPQPGKILELPAF
jgi:hypothetical protein